MGGEKKNQELQKEGRKIRVRKKWNWKKEGKIGEKKGKRGKKGIKRDEEG